MISVSEFFFSVSNEEIASCGNKGVLRYENITWLIYELFRSSSISFASKLSVPFAFNAQDIP